MRFSLALAATLPVITVGSLYGNKVDIVMSNDDGWAEMNIRAFYDALNYYNRHISPANSSVVLSAPALNMSGTGSLNGTAELVKDGCQFGSCPASSPGIGFNSSDPHLNYVNAFPVTAMSYGITTLSPKIFGGPPDFAVSGPNVGSNFDIQVPFSGTVGAAVAAINLGIPAISFSGKSGSQISYTDEPVPFYAKAYAELAIWITFTLTRHPIKPYLPEGVWLNVNFPTVDWDTKTCVNYKEFKFILSRIYPAIPFVDAPDVKTCGSDRLPTERSVLERSGCYVSISVGNKSKLDAGEAAQKVVLEKLSDLLSCLP
ncbi:5'/3'-nucleotidase SurE family protein [Diplocarpon rosae]|nr:5'/3'-nucleotidase SurE family protein [Diplocarpon rosae]